MIELWFNGVLQGYFKTPEGFASAREYANYYNSGARIHTTAYAIAI